MSINNEESKRQSSETTILGNPIYQKYLPNWNQMQDTVVEGEQGVKSQGTTYLPKTEGQISDGDSGESRYQNYKKRAVYYNYPLDTVTKATGKMHRKPAIIELPSKLIPLINKATVDGESLQDALSDINYNQLVFSRLGILADFANEVTNRDVLPYLTIYKARSIIDWNERAENEDTILEFVLLDESVYEFDKSTKEWEEVEYYRVLGLHEEYYYNKKLTKEEYLAWDFNNPELYENDFPKSKGNKLNKIPFVFCNITHIKSDVEVPVLMEQSNLSLAIYRGEADYRQYLYKQSFENLFIAGIPENEVKQVAVDGVIHTSNENAKSEYVGISGKGLTEQRLALDNLKEAAKNTGIVVLDKTGVESNEAIKTRMSLQTTNLVKISMTGALALKEILRIIAEWENLSEAEIEQIKIIPNLDFSSEMIPTTDVANLWETIEKGGFSKKDYYEILKKNDYTTFSTYEEWEKELPIQTTIYKEKYNGTNQNNNNS